MRACEVCGAMFWPNDRAHRQRFCGLSCANHAAWLRRRKRAHSDNAMRRALFEFRAWQKKSGKHRELMAAIRAKGRERSCKECGRAFCSSSSHPFQLYCSQTCYRQVQYRGKRARYKPARYERICATCNQRFVAGRKDKRFCSRRHAALYRWWRSHPHQQKTSKWAERRAEATILTTAAAWMVTRTPALGMRTPTSAPCAHLGSGSEPDSRH